MVSKTGEIYVYTDYLSKTDESGRTVNTPGVKFGDGNAYVVDLPFINCDFESLEKNLNDHIIDSAVHVTQSEKDFWNGKYRAIVDGETLSFTVG